MQKVVHDLNVHVYPGNLFSTGDELICLVKVGACLHGMMQCIGCCGCMLIRNVGRLLHGFSIF